MPTPPFAEFNYTKVSKWMREELRRSPETYLDCGEVNSTLLAENAAAEFKAKDQPGPLDDETHWLWVAAADTAAWYEKQPKLEVKK